MSRIPLSLRILLLAALVAVAFSAIGAVIGLDARTVGAVALLAFGLGALGSGTVLVADLKDARAEFERWTAERRAALTMSPRVAGAYQLIMGALLVAYVVAILTVLT